MKNELSEHNQTNEDVLDWLIRNCPGVLLNHRISRPIPSTSGRKHFASEELREDIGDGSPLSMHAVDMCWEKCQQFQSAHTSSGNPNMASAARIQAETGVSVDANPYFGLTRAKLDAVIRAADDSKQMPETLLALWAKEGSHRMVTTARSISQATTAQNAKTIFRCQVYYVDLGIDQFIVTTRLPGGDNTWDDNDSAASGHETYFATKVRELARDRDLSEDISGAVNSELSVRASAPFSVTPSIKFYALSLLLVDALFSRLQRNNFPQLTNLSPELNYMQWNMGTGRFRDFLASADNHRREAAFMINGQPISVEQWALHTIPNPAEWRQPRMNAIRFMHLIESYRPIFQPFMNLIKPGLEDLSQVVIFN